MPVRKIRAGGLYDLRDDRNACEADPFIDPDRHPTDNAGGPLLVSNGGSILASAEGRLWALNRASPRRRDVRHDEVGWIEAVKTSQAGGDRMFMDGVATERTHFRCARVRTRLRAEG
jgi:hypothetical protein